MFRNRIGRIGELRDQLHNDVIVDSRRMNRRKSRATRTRKMISSFMDTFEDQSKPLLPFLFYGVN